MSRNSGVSGPAKWLLSLSMTLATTLAAPALIVSAQDPVPVPVPVQKQEATVEKKAEPKVEKKKRAERKEDPNAKWAKMEYGTFLAASIKAPGKDNNANKGIAIKLGKGTDKNPAATICFDTDLLRVSGAWTGGFLNLLGTPFDGSHGSWPTAKGEPVFSTKVGPGWAKGDDDFKDPRSEPFRPLACRLGQVQRSLPQRRPRGSVLHRGRGLGFGDALGCGESGR